MIDQVDMKVKLADARAELGVTQVALAVFASVSKQTVVNAEKGLAIQRIQAHRILKAINTYREQAGKAPLSITEIDWRIFGD